MRRHKILILIFILCPSFSFAQYGPLLNEFAKIYPSECPKIDNSPSEERSIEPEGYSGHDYTQEPKHYSWDNLYLEYEGPEVIVNPYEGLEEDDEEEL